MTQHGQTLRFRCPGCSVTMRANQAEAGEKRKCPKCKAMFRIPQARGVERSRVLKAKPKKKEPSLVPVVCGVCNTRVYANPDQVGTSVECPDCFTQNLVKPPKKKKTESRVNLDKIGQYDLAPAQEIKVIQTLGEDRLEEADEVVQQEIDAAPRMPKKPFLQGIFTYPFRLNVLPTLIGIAMAWTFLLVLISGAWGLEGFAATIAPFILGAAAFFFTLVVIPSLVTFQIIMENGANGDDETEIRPDGGLFTMIEWIVDVLPIVISGTISCVPTLGVFHLVLLARDAPLTWRWQTELGLGFMAYLLFPLIFLSMLENNSILGFYSGQVWGSIAKKSSSWIKFGLIATLLFIGFVGIGFAFVKLLELPWTGITLAGLVTAMSALICLLAIYFRLLGRLAFVLTFLEPVDEKRARRADPAMV